MKNIPLGLYSGVVAALVWLGSFAGFAVLCQNQLFFFKHPMGLLALNLGILTIPGLALLGVGWWQGLEIIPQYQRQKGRQHDSVRC